MALAIVGVTTSLSAQTRAALSTLRGSSDFVNGDPVGLVISGLRARDTATVRAYRRFIVPVTREGRSASDTVLFYSTATVRADARGRVVVDSAVPVAGSWQRADPLGIFWSMQRLRDTSPAWPHRVPARGTVDVVLLQNGVALDSLVLRTTAPKGLTERVVVSDSLVGAYAAPSDDAKHPALLVLHGSEGGDTTSAKALARRFAARGFATFAVVYVAYPYTGGFAGVPSAFVNIPVETMDHARNWLGGQAEADTVVTGIWGVSKGAELAVVTAASRTWPRAVVACVPSDVVWMGFGQAAQPGAMMSSWSDNGHPLPYIQYDRYDDVFANLATARQVHDRSRIRFAADVSAARIDVSRIHAPLLLFGGEADEVWNSSDMSRSIAREMRRANSTRVVTAVSFPQAGHGICGDGTTPAELFPQIVSPDPRATAAANSRTWREALAFLHARLR